MKTILIISSILTGILLFSTTVCGLWIRNQGTQLADRAGALNFHLQIGLATAICGMLTIILTLIWIAKK